MEKVEIAEKFNNPVEQLKKKEMKNTSKYLFNNLNFLIFMVSM